MGYFMIWNHTVWQQRWTIYLSAHWKSTFCVAYHSCTEIFQSTLTVQILLNSCKEKKWVTCHFSVSFSYFSCYFNMGKKQIIHHIQKEQIFDISFHTLHIVTALLCVGDFFFIWMEIYLIQSTGKFTFHFYSIAGITVMLWNRHKLGNTY